MHKKVPDLVQCTGDLPREKAPSGVEADSFRRLSAPNVWFQAETIVFLPPALVEAATASVLELFSLS